MFENHLSQLLISNVGKGYLNFLKTEKSQIITSHVNNRNHTEISLN